ncbi:MAG: hypothetical protein U9Q81_24665 [Pseudomonadota bacterium]|nr:hypothetical protein [Pseudomonadota bacterium]
MMVIEGGMNAGVTAKLVQLRPIKPDFLTQPSLAHAKPRRREIWTAVSTATEEISSTSIDDSFFAPSRDTPTMPEHTIRIAVA